MTGEEMERALGELKGLVSSLQTSLNDNNTRVTRLEVLREQDARRIDANGQMLNAIDTKLDEVLLRLSADETERRINGRQSRAQRDARIAATSGVVGAALGWALQHVGLR